MNDKLLKQIGLTDSQAKTYLALIREGALTPPQLAHKTKEGRTAAYMALSKLEELGLAHVKEGTNPKTYEPASPSVLSQLLDKRKQELEAIDETYRQSLSAMLSYYFERRSEPGVRFFSGRDGLREIYKDHLQTGKKVHIVRTPADEEFGQVLYDYMEERSAKGIETELLAPALPAAVSWAKAHDEQLKRKVSWLPPKAYTAPVEISIYGDKASLISFGAEAVGVIIESPQIAEALRQVFALAKVGAGMLMSQEEKK